MKHISKHALIIFLLWAFAPAAWFLLWQDKKYHSWFPKLLWINGIIFAVIFTTQSFVVVPKLEALYTALHISIPQGATPIGILLVLAFVLLQIPIGIYLQKKIIKHKALTDSYVLPILFIFLIDGIIALSTGLVAAIQSPTALIARFPQAQVQVVHTPIPTFVPASPKPTPTPKPISFAQLNKTYGPCAFLPTFMYHHIEDETIAQKRGQTGLNVTPTNFESQMQYLSDRGYKTVTMQDLVNFFNNEIPIAPKSILLTFDDGYQDFYTNAYPILKKMNFKATMFTPTGLIGNPDYLTWDEITNMIQGGLVLFANHTWSHHPMNKIEADTLDQELNLPDRTLSSYNTDDPKVFAYPYGTVGNAAEVRLASLGYSIAFTTQPGSVLCKKQALTLPRVRIGNEPLSKYGY